MELSMRGMKVGRPHGGPVIVALALLGAAPLIGCDTRAKTARGDEIKSAAETAAHGAGAIRRLTPGLWETAMTVNGHAMSPARVCITKALADEINGDDASVRRGLAQSNAAPGCEVKNVEIDGARVAFDTICDGQAIHSAITYQGDRYTGEMTGSGTGLMALSARHVGNCPSEQAG